MSWCGAWKWVTLPTWACTGGKNPHRSEGCKNPVKPLERGVRFLQEWLDEISLGEMKGRWGFFLLPLEAFFSLTQKWHETPTSKGFSAGWGVSSGLPWIYLYSGPGYICTEKEDQGVEKRQWAANPICKALFRHNSSSWASSGIFGKALPLPMSTPFPSVFLEHFISPGIIFLSMWKRNVKPYASCTSFWVAETFSLHSLSTLVKHKRSPTPVVPDCGEKPVFYSFALQLCDWWTHVAARSACLPCSVLHAHLCRCAPATQKDLH